uniref:Secreted protein n=1 Tax=Cacopsylla melanoneura TaxID=428564 RepID=A0A8D8QSD6_9HEMI
MVRIRLNLSRVPSLFTHIRVLVHFKVLLLLHTNATGYGKYICLCTEGGLCQCSFLFPIQTRVCVYVTDPLKSMNSVCRATKIYHTVYACTCRNIKAIAKSSNFTTKTLFFHPLLGSFVDKK